VISRTRTDIAGGPLGELPIGYDPNFGYETRWARCPFAGEIKENEFVCAENLSVLQALNAASIDLIYGDPPFFSGRQYQKDEAKFSDTWPGGLSDYLSWLNVRLIEMRRVLKPSGMIYIHLDGHASHYVKIEMDKIFGESCFLNNVVWCYGLGGSSSRYWPRKHDDILVYSREPNGHFFEADRVPATSQRMKGKDKKATDFWDIPTLNNMAIERLGYPTQKPEVLMERIVKSSCPPGGIVADFFAGSGTTAAVSERLGFSWISCDSSPVAIEMAQKRLVTLRNQG